MRHDPAIEVGGVAAVAAVMLLSLVIGYGSVWPKTAVEIAMVTVAGSLAGLVTISVTVQLLNGLWRGESP